MPPRFAYWTIIIDDQPTAFRARERDELLPTFRQLSARNPNAIIKWFSNGRLWDSPEQARAARAAANRPPERGADWRPGGRHEDPRARFDRKRRPKPRDERTPQPDRSGEGRPAGFDERQNRSRPPSGPRREGAARGGQSRDRRPPGGRDARSAAGSKPPRPRERDARSATSSKPPRPRERDARGQGGRDNRDQKGQKGQQRPWERGQRRGGPRGKPFGREKPQRPNDTPARPEPPVEPPPRPPGPDRPPKPGQEPRPDVPSPETIKILPEPPERAK